MRKNVLRDNFDFLERLRMTTSLESSACVLSALLKQYGFGNLIYGFFSPGDKQDNIPNISVASTLPEEFLKIYYESGGVKNDPIVNKLPDIKATEDHDNLALYDGGSLYRRHPLLVMLLDHSIDYGLISPIRQRNGLGSILTFSNSENRKERICASRNEDNKCLVEHATGIFHEYVHNNGFLKEMYNLTVKEVDTLNYIANGLSGSQIADRLKISERAVEKRLASARNKLGANNSANAVYRAMVLGLI